MTLLKAAEIDWAEADADHVRLHVGSTIHTVRDTMNDLEERLRSFGFARVHRSAIVNMSAVEAVEPISKGDYYLVLRTGARIRSSRQYRRDVQSLIPR